MISKEVDNMLLPRRKWRDIKGYEGLYQVSNLGEVRSLNYGRTGKTRILKPRDNGIGYKTVTLSKNGKIKNFFIHRLVAEAFIPNPNNLPQVNHKDEDKANNIWTNLEWCNHEYNCNYGTRNEKMSRTKGKSIKCITTGETFNSIKEASRYYGVPQNNIVYCLKGRRKSAGKDFDGNKLLWKYID